MLIPSPEARFPASATRRQPSGSEIVSIDGVPHALIRHVETLPPFLMNVVSDGDLWIFATSNGGLTAGRRDPDAALFPYRPADQLQHEPRSSGIFSLLRVDGQAWAPWAAGTPPSSVSRTLAKHELGCSVIFEETNAELGLRFRWRVGGASAFGLVREATLENLTDRPRRIDVLDGWHRLLPPGVGEQTYARFSYLAAAYMWQELLEPEGLLVAVLNSAISDRPEPSESLRATVAWSLGLRGRPAIIADGQEAAFLAGGRPPLPPTARGRFGAYLVSSSIQLAPGARHEWFMVADTGLDQSAVLRLRGRLGGGASGEATLAEELRAGLRREAAGLWTRIAAVDGFQATGDRVATVHHVSNALFNIMRGGLPASGGSCPAGDLTEFLESRNRPLLGRHQDWLTGVDGGDLEAVRSAAAERGDPQLTRLVSEYLPLCFSRRHGDPSRPWNRFSIRTRDEAGRPACGYAGNWRDIFQNWEALGHSQPTLLPAMVAVFLNATTADGYNAYRITREGIDWEVPDPADPWSHIGYWGDHQIVYLLRLLEAHERFWPGRLAANLNERRHAYAVVPYRIVGFDALCSDPRHSIRFEEAVHRRRLERVAAIGGDGRLLAGSDGEPLPVSLAEKLLMPALVKLTNLVPGGGIWLNTQRPEWNDANNALAGWGLSVVTACHLRRYLSFIDRLLATAADGMIRLGELAAPLVEDLAAALRDGGDQAEMFERLGRVGERHRESVYRTAFAEPAAAADAESPIATAAIRGLIARGIDLLDETIRGNLRPDGLYHAYNVLELPAADVLDLDAGKLTIRRLEPMLEGQVAVLSSGLLSDAEAVALLTALRGGPLYRRDQQSYLLQPDREPPSFLDRNRLPSDWRQRVPHLANLATADDAAVIRIDPAGVARFHADLTNAADLEAAVERLGGVTAAERAAVLELWEEVFAHRSFTGRSGSFFAFEGLGSIYWHMVAKLLLAVQECHARAAGPARSELAAAYHRIRDGLGFRKSAVEYGAFPTDAYSHTPRHAGAQQPGMTGQVKEELLTRLGELGMAIEAGGLRFAPELLAVDELLAAPGQLDYLDVGGEPCSLPVPAGGLAFTFCQVPITYRFGAAASITVRRPGGPPDALPGNRLPAPLAEAIFRRSGEITALEVSLPGGRS